MQTSAFSHKQWSDLYYPVSLALGHLEKNEIPPSPFFPTADPGHHLSGKETTSRSPAPGPSLTPGRGPWLLWPQILELWELLTLASFSDLVIGLWLYCPMPTAICLIKVWGTSPL